MKNIDTKIEKLIQEFDQAVLDAVTDVMDNTKGIEDGIPVVKIPDENITVEPKEDQVIIPDNPTIKVPEMGTGNVPAGLLKK